MRSLVVRDAALPAGSGRTAVDVVCVDGHITSIGPVGGPLPEGAEALDARGCLVLPGLVNGHTHAAMTLFRGWGDDLPLMEWLERRIWPAEARLTPDDVYWGTRVAIAEMVRTGTLGFWDMYWHGEAVGRAVLDSGARGVLSSVVFDGLDPAVGRASRSRVLDELDRLAEFGPRVRPSLGPHAVYTVSEATLAWLGEVARERGLPVQIHCSETADEVTRCRADHGVSPVGLLDRCGLLGPDVVLAHAVWCDTADLALIAERGATVVTNPVSNMKLAVGAAFPAAAAAAAGIPIGLGTDGTASNNSLDLLADAKVLCLLQKHTHADAAMMPATEAWAIATGARAPALGGTPEVAVGAPADFLLVDDDPAHLGPGTLEHNLVYAASAVRVRHAVVDGAVVLRDGSSEGEQEARERLVRAARRLGVD
ncbi:MAG: amidohydrolase [Actinomycetes bacterium]